MPTRKGPITADHCRMGRAAARLTVEDLAKAADVSTNTIVRLERGGKVFSQTNAAIRAALESAGVEFIDENGGGPGVRLRR